MSEISQTSAHTKYVFVGWHLTRQISAVVVCCVASSCHSEIPYRVKDSTMR
jgi:hypothetical protein